MAGIDAGLAGPLSPPRRNGEIVFDAPWERRVFGVTIALCRSGAVGWDDFRRKLIRHIADHQARPYWQSWAIALEDVLACTSVLPQAELDARQRELLVRPAGHDHDQ